MARIFPTAAARIGIVTLAALGAFALPVAAGAAQAATTTAAADCATLQATYDGLQAWQDTLEERLAVATPAQKPGLIAQIVKVAAQLDAVRAQMDAAGCA